MSKSQPAPSQSDNPYASPETDAAAVVLPAGAKVRTWAILAFGTLAGALGASALGYWRLNWRFSDGAAPGSVLLVTMGCIVGFVLSAFLAAGLILSRSRRQISRIRLQREEAARELRITKDALRKGGEG